MAAIGWLLILMAVGVIYLEIHNQSVSATFAKLFSPATTTGKTIT